MCSQPLQCAASRCNVQPAAAASQPQQCAASRCSRPAPSLVASTRRCCLGPCLAVRWQWQGARRPLAMSSALLDCAAAHTCSCACAAAPVEQRLCSSACGAAPVQQRLGSSACGATPVQQRLCSSAWAAAHTYSSACGARVRGCRQQLWSGSIRAAMLAAYLHPVAIDCGLLLACQPAWLTIPACDKECPAGQWGTAFSCMGAALRRRWCAASARCCAVWCCAVWCCAVLCCAVLCCGVLPQPGHTGQPLLPCVVVHARCRQGRGLAIAMMEAKSHTVWPAGLFFFLNLGSLHA